MAVDEMADVRAGAGSKELDGGSVAKRVAGAHVADAAGAHVTDERLAAKKAELAAKKAKPKDPFVRAETEDDDGYDPYSDRHPQAEPLFERDPWS